MHKKPEIQTHSGFVDFLDAVLDAHCEACDYEAPPPVLEENKRIFDRFRADFIRRYGNAGAEPSEIPAILWPRPIPVTERLPEPNAPIMAFDAGLAIWRIGIYDTEAKYPLFNSCDAIILWERITHWLPLPPEPE